MTVITTSTAPTATAYSNQRKIDRCANGVDWAMFWDGTSNTSSSMHFRYSTDGGTSWSDGGGFGFSGTGSSYTPHGSFFIDYDPDTGEEYAHVAYKDRSNGYIYYRRGTPNAARTAWTWSAATALYGSSDCDYPDIVAHREGAGWVAHVTLSYNNGTAYYKYVTIASGGGFTVTPSGSSLTPLGGGSGTAHSFPSIDFNHTGDGKTVAGGTPHLYVAWSAGATGSGRGVRFKKATYSGGSWAWGTEREIDSARYINSTYDDWINCLFDGSRVVIAGLVYNESVRALVAHERDAADTTTTPRVLIASATTGSYLAGGSVTYDSAGNLHFVGKDLPAWHLDYVKWTRGGSLSTPLQVADGLGNYAIASVKRGYSNSRIEFIYTDGTSSPYSVTYGGITLNAAPDAPSLSAPANGANIDRTSTNRFDWDFSDPDPGDSQSKYDLHYRLVGAATWTDVTGTTPNTFHDFTAGTFAEGDYEWQVRTYDAQGVVGPYSSSSFFTAATAPAAPTITAPINGSTVSQSELVEWSTPTQDSYQLRVLDGATPVYDSGEVVSATARSQTVAYPDNSTTRTTQVRVKDGGLWSQYAEVTNTVSWTPPTTPVVSLLPDNDAGSLVVTITNPAPTGDQPPTSYNDVFINDGDGEERRATMLTPNTSWTYWTPKAARDYTGSIRVEAVADNDVRSSS